MATTLAERIVGKLIAASAVEEVDRELYVYGVFLLITRFFFFLVTIAFGCLLGIPFESVIFYIVFILLRSYAGGVHAKTEMACTIWTTLAIGITVAVIKMLEASNGKIWLLIFFSNLCIFFLSPLESNEKPLDWEESQRYHRICNRLLLIYDMLALAADFMFFPILHYPVACSMILEAILLGIGRICGHMKYKFV